MPKSLLQIVSVAPAIRTHTSAAPLYSSQPAAGFPAPGDDLVERPLDLNELLIRNETATFYVRVSGDSMEGLRVFDNDILVVDRSLKPESGTIVVAAVCGELVVKQLVQTREKTQLVSAHTDYSPIDIADDDDVYVWGVVVGSVRKIGKQGV